MLDLAKIFKNLITEAVQANRIVLAIKETRVIKIYYAGDNINKPGFRTIEPYCYGYNRHGNLCLRAWQQGGVSDTPDGTLKKGGIDPLSKIPGWRMFRTDKISSWDNIASGSGEKGKSAYKIFDSSQAFISANRPKYNSKDKDMSSIIMALIPKSDNTPPVEPTPEPNVPVKPVGEPKNATTKTIKEPNKNISKDNKQAVEPNNITNKKPIKPVETPIKPEDDDILNEKHNRKRLHHAIMNNFHYKNVFLSRFAGDEDEFNGEEEDAD